MTLGLPTELIWHVLCFLNDSDLASFRATCRQFDHMSLEYFGRRRFRTKQFMLSYDGLHALCSLARGRFGRFVETLRIGSEALACGRSTAKTEQSLRLQELCEEQTYFRQRGQDTALLAVALTAMKGSLVEIVVSGFSSKGGVRSWGVLELEKETGTTVILEQTRTLSIVLAAVASSQAQPRIVRNEPLLGQHGIGAHCDAIAIPRPGMALLSIPFRQLRVLQLNLWTPGGRSDIAVRSLSTNLMSLLRVLTNLEELYLGLQRVLAVPKLGAEVGAAPFSTRLRRLYIDGGHTEEAVLLALIRNHIETLREITFTRVSLRGGWNSLISHLGLEIMFERLEESDIVPIITVLDAWDTITCQKTSAMAWNPSASTDSRDALHCGS
ncbi:hypothetical protein B0J12DRAFT_705378 [Macrophomina phaseolina]|uniref:F-box domain-containing protein n=1 Tax=Macrophomina phaseolina TaxID=35725 RepID=A0ABQ8FSA7_9PEZI|nr:hypothetical protein B0J12DRAFT_705378 [Macrophomina phaseolina]